VRLRELAPQAELLGVQREGVPLGEAKKVAKGERKAAQKAKERAGVVVTRTDAQYAQALANARVSTVRTGRSTRLAAAESARREAVAEAARAKNAQGRARGALGVARGRSEILSRNVGGAGGGGGYGIELGSRGLQAASERVKATRAAVREADRVVAAERQRVSGVAPGEHDALLRAIAARDEARAALAQKRVGAKVAKKRHIAVKRGELVEPADQFVARVQSEANRAGLGAPGYFPSEKRPRGVRGSLSRAVDAAQPYTGTLTRTGRENADPQAFVRAIAENVNRKASWNYVADTFDRHAFEWSRGLTPGQIKDELDRRGIDAGSVALWNPGAYRAAHQAQAQLEGGDIAAADVTGENAAAHAALTHAAPSIDLRRLDTQPEAFLHSRGWAVVPKAVHDELTADTRPSGAGMRTYDIAKGKASRILLGNPAWLQFQVGANALLTGLAGTGPVDAAKAQLWWRKLSVAERDAIEPHIGVHKFYDEQTHLGAATNNRIVNAYRAFKETGLYKAAHKANPLDAIFRADNAQNSFFRKAVFYTQAKRAAYRDMGQTAGQMMRLQHQITGLMTLGPTERMRALARNQGAIDDYAHHVNSFLGDYTTYTHRERKILGRAVMFYGFLRYSLRFAFYTMPIEHPVMASILTQVGRLERDELQNIFGTDVPPWEVGNYFSKDGRTKVALTRLSPFFNAIQWQGPQSIVGAFSPLAQITVNQVAGKNVAFDQLYTTDGSTQYRVKAADIGAANRAQIALQELMSTSPYYRAAAKTGIPGLIGPLRGRQTDDASLFKAQPVHFKRPDKIAENQKLIAQQNRQGGVKALEAQFAPLAGAPGSDVIAKARERAKPKVKAVRRKNPIAPIGGGGSGTLRGSF
jgi:hypothetical protein